MRPVVRGCRGLHAPIEPHAFLRRGHEGDRGCDHVVRIRLRRRTMARRFRTRKGLRRVTVGARRAVPPDGRRCDKKTLAVAFVVVVDCVEEEDGRKREEER